MVARLTRDHVRSVCEERGFDLLSYKNSRSKIIVNCKSCEQNPQEYCWSQIRDGQICRYCSGAKVDLLEPFRRHGLRPLEEPETYRSKVNVECINCAQCLSEKTSYKNLERIEDTPCWVCNSYQLEKRNSFLAKGWELSDKYTSRDRFYLVQCKTCGHWSDIHGKTVEKWSANCPVCRNSRLYRLIGARLEVLEGELKSPLDLQDLKKKAAVFCHKCGTPGALVFKDVVYGRQGFCSNCALTARAEKRRRHDYIEHLDRLSLEYVSGNYINEDSLISYKCKRCNLSDRTTVGLLRSRTVGCLYCAGKKLGEDPLGLFREKGFTPLEPFRGHQVPLLCICPRCSDQCRPTRLNLQQGHFGCTCILEDNPGVYNKTFFEKNKSLKCATGGVYLIEFTDIDGTIFYKIGIHLARTNRVDAHVRQTGKCVQYAVAALYDCWRLEQFILEQVSEVAYTPLITLRGGSTECFREADLSIESFWSEVFHVVPEYFVQASKESNLILNTLYPNLRLLTEMPCI